MMRRTSALMSLLTMLHFAAAEGMQITGLQPYMEITHPPAGSAFVLDEDEFFCVLAMHNLNASSAARAEFSIEILDESGSRISAASGPVEGQTDLHADGTRILNVNLKGLQKGRYGLRTRLLVGSIQQSFEEWHPFQVQRPVFASSSLAAGEVNFPAGTPGESAQSSEHTHQVVALVRIRNCARAVQHFLRALSFFVHQIVVLDDASVDQTAKMVQEVASECRVARILTKGPRDIGEPDPWGDMQALLHEGRALGGTHFVVVHSDELFSTSLVMDGSWWTAMRALEVGDSLSGDRSTSRRLLAEALGLVV